MPSEETNELISAKEAADISSKKIIDKITDDVFTCDVIEMCNKFRDKADRLQYGLQLFV